MSERPESSPSKSARDAVGEVHRLFLTHIDVIRGFIRALVRDPHLAEDVLQETFLTVAKKASTFEPGTSFPKWACAIARFKVLETSRRKAGRMTFLSQEAIETLAIADDIPERDVRLEVIDECIDELPPSMRKMIDLRYVVDHKPAEIARLIGWSVEAVYVGLSRARSALKACIESKLNESEGRA